MATWVNPDGQTVRFGTDQAKTSAVGEPKAYGPVKTIVATINGKDVTSAGGLIGGTGLQNDILPAGVVILRANLVVTTTFVGATATLDIGLCNTDESFTNLSANGIVAAATVASLVAGSVIAAAGALVGAGTSRATTVKSYLSHRYNTAAFTAGQALLVVEYVAPLY